jgi:hypothetical protein
MLNRKKRTMAKRDEIMIGAQVTTPYGAGIVQWIAGAHRVTVKIYSEPRPRILPVNLMVLWPTPKHVSIPYTTDQVKHAIADWNHPLATSSLAFALGEWLDDNNLAVVPRPTEVGGGTGE